MGKYADMDKKNFKKLFLRNNISLTALFSYSVITLLQLTITSTSSLPLADEPSSATSPTPIDHYVEAERWRSLPHFEAELIKELMSSYDPAARPSHNFSIPLMVTFSLSLHHIVDVDEKNQILTTNCWLTQVWNDVHLTWNASKFNGIDVIRLPYARVWRPDLILYNNADSQYSSAVINTNVIVSSNGEVTWLSHGIYKSSCDINVEYFPFDIQNCTLKWASWTYDGYQLDLQVEDVLGDTSNYHANGEFDLLTLEAVRNVKIYSCCPEPYPDITYTIVMKRRPMFYVFNLIIPCLLINGIALLVFFVPCESGEKVTLGISALLSMTVFLMTIRESLPPTEKTPLIGLYYGASICIVTFASAMAVMTLNIHHQSVTGVPVPAILRFLVLGLLSRLVRLHHPPLHDSTSCTSTSTSTDQFSKLGNFKRNNKHYVISDSNIATSTNFNQQLVCTSTSRSSSSSNKTMAVQLNAEGASRKCHYIDYVQRSPRFYSTTNPAATRSNYNLEEEPTGPGSVQVPVPSISADNNEYSFLTSKMNDIITKISKVLEKCDQRNVVEVEVEISRHEWKQIARIVDRLLFWIFTLLTLIATTLILFSSPYGPSITHLWS